MRPALTVLDAISRRRLAPVITLGVCHIAVGKKGDQDGADRRLGPLLFIEREKTCLLNQWAVASIASPFQGLPGGLLSDLIVQAAIRLNAPERTAKQRNQLEELIRPRRSDCHIIGG